MGWFEDLDRSPEKPGKRRRRDPRRKHRMPEGLTVLRKEPSRSFRFGYNGEVSKD